MTASPNGSLRRNGLGPLPPVASLNPPDFALLVAQQTGDLHAWGPDLPGPGSLSKPPAVRQTPLTAAVP